MLAQITSKGGLTPLVLPDVTQVVIRHVNGTILMVAAIHGNDQTVVVSKVGDKDFNKVLQQLAINETVIAETVKL